MSETSLKSAYMAPWVKSTVAWHCRLISSKMKWSFPEECPCYTLAIPTSGFLTFSDLKTKQLWKLSAPTMPGSTCFRQCGSNPGNMSIQDSLSVDSPNYRFPTNNFLLFFKNLKLSATYLKKKKKKRNKHKNCFSKKKKKCPSSCV